MFWRERAESRNRLIIPALEGLYRRFGPLSEALLRVLSGLILATHGYGKITEPMGNVAMVEGLGFVPGTFWSPALAATEFFGGLLLAAGLLTRPAALGATIVLAVTAWFHWIVQAEGLGGAEFSIIWAAACLYFVFNGGGRYSVDRALGREF